MGLKPEDDKRPSKLAIMDDMSDTPRKFFFLFYFLLALSWNINLNILL